MNITSIRDKLNRKIREPSVIRLSILSGKYGMTLHYSSR